MRVDPGLGSAVEAFVTELSPVMEAVTLYVEGYDADELRRDVVVEAQQLAAAFIDADGLQTDDELWAYIATFGPLHDTQLVRATPADVRRSGIVTGCRSFLDQPSSLFEILVDLDRRQGSRRSFVYYERAMHIAHTIASIDAHVSSVELQEIEAFRSRLLQRLDAAGVRSAGRDRPEDRPPAPAPDPTPGSTPTDAAPAATGGASPGERVDEPAGESARTGSPGEAEAEPEPLPPPRPIEDLLAELDRLIGLEAVKQEVKLVAALIRVQNLRRERGLPVVEQSRHLVFVGNPGTGKTTVARILAEIYRTLGVVERGHLVETDRSGLVAGFVGQTATRVVEVFDRADQGVLLIDEAYALARGSEQDFGREAIDTLVKLVEDRRDRVVVIVAGYPVEMEVFVDSNPGLRSRFPKTIAFPDYSTDELMEILRLRAEDAGYELTPDAEAAVRTWLEIQPRTKGFGNGRLARNLLEATITRHASRVVELDDPTDDDLTTLHRDDVPPPTPVDEPSGDPDLGAS